MMQSFNYRLDNGQRGDWLSCKSDSSSSNSGYNAGNRSRTNTGDSSISSSDNGSNIKPLSARRRSHRPRGCRGGRKNKKNKQPVPAEITSPMPGALVPLSPRENIQIEKHENQIQLKKIPSRTETMPDFRGLPPRNPPGACGNIASMSMMPVQPFSFVGVAFPSDTMGEILPPPPVMERSPSPVLTGPNPYALSANKPNLNVSIAMPQPQPQPQPILNAEGFLPFFYDYRDQCIEKQRHMLSDGGSLFVTSPRSFLTGAKRPSMGSANTTIW